jgi:hypothetical protein
VPLAQSASVVQRRKQIQHDHSVFVDEVDAIFDSFLADPERGMLKELARNHPKILYRTIVNRYHQWEKNQEWRPSDTHGGCNRRLLMDDQESEILSIIRTKF